MQGLWRDIADRQFSYGKAWARSRLQRVYNQERINKQQRAEAMYDAMFVGMQPCEVLQIMGRAKRWLEARGYEIVLRGSLTVKKDVKFE